MNKQTPDIVAALDVGTSKILAIVARRNPQGTLKLLGVGRTERAPRKAGAVVGIDTTVRDMQQAIQAAQAQAGVPLARVRINFGHSRLVGLNFSVRAEVHGEVSPQHLAQLQQATAHERLDEDMELLWRDKRGYAVDGASVDDPLGLSAGQLDFSYYAFAGPRAAVSNLRNCLRRCGLEPELIVPNPVAAARSVTSANEREAGVAVLDMGAALCSVTVFRWGQLEFAATLPLAGDVISNDIAIALRTPLAAAEDIKIAHGWARQQEVDPSVLVDVLSFTGPARSCSEHAIAGLIEPRVEEIFSLVRLELQNAGYAIHGLDIVVTGGSTGLEDFVDHAQDIFGAPTRVAKPLLADQLPDDVLPAEAATALGLLLHETRVPAGTSGIAPKPGLWRRLFS